MEMCETCQQAPWKPSTASSAGSPANLFRTRVDGKLKVMIGGCGPSSPVWWMSYDPQSSSWRTSPGCGPQELLVPRSSLILPRSATTFGGTVYLLPPSERPTFESGSLLWPTPTAQDDNKSPAAHLAMKKRMGGGRTKPTSLQVMAKGVEMGLWPTPTASDWKGSRKFESLREWGSRGTNLPEAVQRERGSGARPGMLNPEWVEWLMGFPPRWTDCE